MIESIFIVVDSHFVLMKYKQNREVMRNIVRNSWMLKTATSKEDIMSAISDIEMRGESYQKSIMRIFGIPFGDYKEIIETGIIKGSGIDLITEKK